HAVFRVLPAGLADLPERGTQRVEAGGGHVDGAEPAMGGMVRRAELLCPPAGERLGLVATREKRELLRVAGADAGEPIGGDAHRLVPFDLAKPAFATLAHAQQRLLQPRRAKVLHDAGIALATEHAAVDRVVSVARNVADGAVLKVHVDAAA